MDDRELPGAGERCDLTGLPGGQVVGGSGTLAFVIKEGRLDEQHVSGLGEGPDCLAIPRVIAGIGDVGDLPAGHNTGDLPLEVAQHKPAGRDSCIGFDVERGKGSAPSYSAFLKRVSQRPGGTPAPIDRVSGCLRGSVPSA